MLFCVCIHLPTTIHNNKNNNNMSCYSTTRKNKSKIRRQVLFYYYHYHQQLLLTFVVAIIIWNKSIAAEVRVASSNTTNSKYSTTSTNTTIIQQQRYDALDILTKEFDERFRPQTNSNSNATDYVVSANTITIKSIRTAIEQFFINLYESVFTPTRLCRLGYTSTCVCTNDALRRAVIRAGSSFDNPTGILICAGTIDISTSDNTNEPINVTDKSFFIGCGATVSRKSCTISGGGRQQIFSGSPIQLFIQNIRLIDGFRSQDDGYGGAIYLSGGKTFIDKVTFENNIATVAGGAIYVGPSAQLSIASADFFRNSASGLDKNDVLYSSLGGGAMYINGGVVIAAGGKYSSNVAPISVQNKMAAGGAILAKEASIRFEEVTFEDNESGNGGAISVDRSIVQLAGTIFEKNDAVDDFHGDSLYIADDQNDEIDGSYVYCDPITFVSFCYGFDDGTAIYEVPGGVNENTNCQQVGYSDIFSEKCSNYIP